jgi:hypothetical protein
MPGQHNHKRKATSEKSRLAIAGGMTPILTFLNRCLLPLSCGRFAATGPRQTSRPATITRRLRVLRVAERQVEIWSEPHSSASLFATSSLGTGNGDVDPRPEGISLAATIKAQVPLSEGRWSPDCMGGVRTLFGPTPACLAVGRHSAGQRREPPTLPTYIEGHERIESADQPSSRAESRLGPS